MHEARRLLPAGIEYMQNPYDACKNADALVLMTEWNQYRALDREKLETLMHRKIFIDLRNVYDPERLKTRGFVYVGVGRS